MKHRLLMAILAAGLLLAAASAMADPDAPGNWTFFTFRERDAPFKIQFVPQGVGFVLMTSGSYSTVKRTCPQKHWCTLRELGHGYRDLFFANKFLGFIAGDGGQIGKTTDGGQVWHALNSGTARRLNAVYFSEPSTGWVVGEGATILKTSDGGKSWRKQRAGVERSFELTGVHFINSRIGWAVGGRIQKGRHAGVVLHTRDGGQSWQNHTGRLPKAARQSYFRGLHVTAAGWAYAVGSKGMVVFTTDDGETYRHHDLQVSAWLNAVHFSDASHGWIVGAEGRMFTTADAGMRWRITRGPGDIPPVEVGNLSDVFALSPKEAWITNVGQRRIYRYKAD